jgi:hypothetical protein
MENMGSPSTGNFRDGWRALKRKHLSLWELLGVLLFGDPEGWLRGRTSLLSIRGSVHQEP